MSFNRDRYLDAIERLTARWSAEYKEQAQALAERINELMSQGLTVDTAVAQAMNEADFSNQLHRKMETAILGAAAAGFGIDPATIDNPKKAVIIERLNTLPWAPDNMSLSSRIHGMDAAIKGAITNTIRQSLNDGANWVKLARALYDGYDYGQVIRTADLPNYMNELQRLARKTLVYDVRSGDTRQLYEFGHAIRRAKRLIARLDGEGVPTKALKTAYQELLDKAQEFSEEAIKKAVFVAVQEKSRYFAERIARTEIARAWTDGFYAATYNDQEIIAYRWRLSSRHPKYDICDFHARANLYGLGPGTYPKNGMPPQPAHPHCMCHLEEVFDGELDGIRRSDDVRRNGNRFLESLTGDERIDLLSTTGALAFDEGEDWRNYMKHWEGHKDPAGRLRPSDF